MRLYGVLACLGVAVYQIVPRDSWWETALQLLVGWGGVAAMLFGVRRLPWRDRLPWWTLALGVLCGASGVVPEAFDRPDLATPLYIGFYPASAVALAWMIRRQVRRVDPAAVVEALIVGAGVALPIWVFAVQPALTGNSEPIALIAYPAGDLVLLGMTVVLIRGAGPGGGTAPRWIAVAISGYLVGDWAWVVLGSLRNGWDDLWWTSRTITGVYLLSLAVFGLAAWRPVIGSGDPGPVRPRHGTRHLVVLSAAGLIPPGLLLSELSAGHLEHGIAIAVGSALMYLLVMARMGQLLRAAESNWRRVRELSRRDELTGLPNRRTFFDELPGALAGPGPVSVAMLDLDRFKQYNDEYGHPAGDRLLKEAAAAWTAALRRSDLLARYGGEEFIVLLPGAGTADAVAALDRARAATPGGATFSAGVATWDGTESAEELIARADSLLYEAKAAGRDRVRSAPAAPAPEVQSA